MNSQSIISNQFEEVFTLEHLIKSAKKCYKGVNWKTSTINYQTKEFLNVCLAYNTIHDETYRCKPGKHRERTERGKKRITHEMLIADRVVQKCFCDYYMVPLLSKSLIYDNGACQKGKGGEFSENRLKAHLQRFYRQNGMSNKGYILTMDFSKFFESIDHELLIEKAKTKIKEERLLKMFIHFVHLADSELEDGSKNCKGVTLGSQISQTCAMFFTNEIDHTIKERLRQKFNARYMDDSYIISTRNKQDLIDCLEVVKEMATEIKLKVNTKKTRIWKIENGFMFLNKHWHLTDSGYVFRVPSHNTLLRQRRRYRYLKANKSPEAVKTFVGCVYGWLKKFRSRRIISYVFGEDAAKLDKEWQNNRRCRNSRKRAKHKARRRKP